MMSEVLLGHRGGTVTWTMVDEQIPLLAGVDDPDGITEVIEVMQRCDRDDTPGRVRYAIRNALRTLQNVLAATPGGPDATEPQRQEAASRGAGDK
jgi:hypothetical protein